MSPEQLSELFNGLSLAFSNRANKVYEGNPEEHGVLAQPYADISDLLAEAAMAFDVGKTEILPSSDASDVFTQKVDDNTGTVSAAVKASTPTSPVRKSPWGDR